MSKATPEEPAPSYDELFSGRPTTTAQSSRFGASRAYAAVPQNDSDGEDTVELASDINTNNNHSTVDGAHDEESHPHTARMVIDPTKPHHHCETCDRQMEKREKHRAEARCCRMVALTFVIAFICATVLGISIAFANAH